MKPVSDIQLAYNTGHRYFGENRVREILNKKDLLPADINGTSSDIFRAIK